MRNSENRNRLFRRWLLVEMCFLAFMTFISMGVYLYADHHIKNQLDELHASNVKQAGAEVAACLAAARSEVDEYITSPAVRTLAAMGVAAGQRELAGLTDDIKQTNSASDAVAEIIVYLKSDDVFISSAGVMDSVLYGELYDGGSLKTTVGAPESYSRFVPVWYGRGGYDTAVYTRQLLNRTFVCAVIDSRRVEQILSENLSDGGNTFFVLSDENAPMFSLDAGIAGEAAALLDTADAAMARDVTVSDRAYVCFTSENDGLTTVSLIDRDSYLAGHLKIQRTAMILLAVSVILGIGISYYITRYKYVPVRDVFNATRAVTPEHVFTGSEDELEQIKSAIAFINAQKEETASVLEKHNAHIKDNALKMLLDGDIDYDGMTAHIKALLDIRPDAVYTAAVMDFVEGAFPAAPDGLKKRSGSLKHTVAKGGRLVLIFECGASEAVKQLSEADVSGLLPYTVAVGTDGTGADGLKDSFNSALFGLSRRILPGTLRVIPPAEGKDLKIVTISAEDDIRLSGLIQSGDETAALSLLDRLEHIPGIGSLDFFSYKSYLFSIANAVIRCAEGAMASEDLRALLLDFNASFEREDHRSITRALRGAVTAAASSYRQKKSSGNKKLNAGVVGYIESRISDPQLSAEMIAGAMSLNAAYLRRFFKEQNGISLWDFINQRRIEKAKNLLVTTDGGVKTIAEDCGYVSIATFTRAFRRFTGMTPGGYRNLYR